MRTGSRPRQLTTSGHFRLTSEGLGWTGLTIALAILAWYKSLNIVLILAYGMAAIQVMNGILARTQIRRVQAVPLKAMPVFAHEPTRIGVRILNLSTRSIVVTVAGCHEVWVFNPIAPGSAAECTLLRSYPQRGRYSFSSFKCYSGFPFGLVQYEIQTIREEDESDSIIVLPALGQVDAEGMRRWILQHARGEGRARKILRRMTADRADVRGVRPYRSGDSIREVHWRTSARRRSLFVREYDYAPSPDLVVIVEPWLPLNASTADHHNLEAALSLAATVAQTWVVTYGTRLILIIASDEILTHSIPIRDPNTVRVLLSSLADVVGSPSTHSPEPSTFDRIPLHAAHVIVSSRPKSTLSAELAQSSRRQFVVLDPTLRYPWYQPPRMQYHEDNGSRSVSNAPGNIT